MNREALVFLKNMPRLLSKAPANFFLALIVLTAKPSQGTSQDAQPALSRPLIISWRYQSDRMSNLTPATDGKTVYLSQTGGTLVALDVERGQLLWRADAGGEFSSAPTVDDRTIYAATEYHDAQGSQAPLRGTLRALSKETGVTLWMRTLPAPIRGGFVAGQNAVFAGAADGRVYAFDKRTGLTLWINQYSEGFSNQPAISGKLVYIGGDAGTLYALDQTSGALAWRYRAHGPIEGQVAIVNGVVYFGSGDGYVYSFSESRSKLLWRRRTGAAVQSVVAVDNGLLAASLDNYAYLLTFGKGSLVWRRLLPGRIPARPLTAPDGVLFTPLSTDSAIVLALKDGKPVNTLTIGEDNSSTAAPIFAAGRVLVSAPHALIAFSAPR